MAEELESNTGDRIALALQGFAAGMQGRGQEFLGQLDERRQNAMIQDAVQVQQAIQQGNIDRAKGLLQQRVELINKLGGDPSDTLGVLGRLNEGDVAGALQDVSTVTEYAYQSGRLKRPESDTSLGEREFNNMIKEAGLTEEEARQARRINLGLSPRAVGSASQTIAEQGKASSVAESEAQIAGMVEGAKTRAQLGEEMKLRPEIAKQVSLAEAAAKAASAATEGERSNASAFNVYESATNSLAEALGKTDTGPVVGYIPAISAEMQIADGAVSMMAPVMKEIFRKAGEGTFTDSDQKLLMGMIPTRKDAPEARIAKLKMIDDIVRAKIGPGAASGARAPARNPPAPPPLLARPDAQQNQQVFEVDF